jgi:hypothetical protein
MVAGSARHTVQSLEHLVRQIEFSCAKVLSQMRDRTVPGIRRILGARRSSQASATCIGVAPRRAATYDNVDDCSGLKPPLL